jgi:hypothetical protein
MSRQHVRARKRNAPLGRTAKSPFARHLFILVAAGLIAAVFAVPASAAKTTITSSVYPGNVVRDDSISLTTHPVARMFSRTTATGNWSVTNPFTAGGGSGAAFGCFGDTGPIGAAGAGNNSPRTNLAISGPAALLNADSPVIDTSISGLIAGFPAKNPQPAPSATNYRGGASAGGTAGNAAFANGTDSRAWNNTVSLAGKPAGVYTVATTTRNMTKSPITTGACTIATPTIPVPNNAAPTAGLQTESLQFEYRPWQHVFIDVFGGGKVNMNIRPAEFQAVVDGNTGDIYDGSTSGGGYMKFYEVGDITTFMLPPDPTTCAADPTTCLPPGAQQCNPQTSSTCDPRLVVINKSQPGDTVRGVFDLKTHAFISQANVRGHQRVLVSLGTDQDAAYKQLLQQLIDAANAQGIDLYHLLATKVRVRAGANEISLSLLNGLQIQPKTGKNGIQIVSDATVQAGLILNIYAALGGPVCTTNVGDSSPTTAAPDRYTHNADAGYTVRRSDLLPNVPRVGVLGALVGGPIYNIEGDFVGTAPALVNTSTAVIGLDTAADEPNGYPIWVEPFLSTPAHTTVARKMDFLGTATWSASETPVTGVGCLTVDFMLGAGVALYNNPLPVGFKDLPIWDPQDPAVAALMAQINAAIQSAADQVGTNPTVNDLLTTILGLLP